MHHPFEPLYDEHSQILILGTFPSVKSRENNFYYAHPHNRFWKVLAHLKEHATPSSIPEKIAFLKHHRIALWDVIAQCDIKGSSDQSITNVTPNDIASLLQKSHISHIFANGAKAYELYQTYCEPHTKQPCIKLPSTSPANATYTFERLLHEWKQHFDGICVLPSSS